MCNASPVVDRGVNNDLAETKASILNIVLLLYVLIARHSSLHGTFPPGVLLPVALQNSTENHASYSFFHTLAPYG